MLNVKPSTSQKPKNENPLLACPHELGNALFSISEPRWTPEEDTQKIKALKRRLHDLYAKYKGIPKPE